MAVATTQVYKLDDDICQPAYGFRLLGSLMHCLLSTERIPSIAADSMEPEHEQFLRRFCASPYVDLSRVFIIIVGATELQPVEAAGQPEVAGHVFENENWTPSLWASGIAPTVDNGIHGGWVAEEIAGFGFENDNRSSGIFCSADNDRQMYQDNTGSSYLEIDEGGPAAVQWKLVEGLFTPDKTIDMLLTLVKVDFPLQREAKWQGLTSSYPPLHALYGNYKAMSTVLEVMGLSADTKSEATRQHEYLGGKELSAEKVLAYFQWSTTSYVKKHGAFSFALEIAADDVCYCPDNCGKETKDVERWFWGIKELFKPGGWIERRETPNKHSGSYLEQCAAEITQTILTDKKRVIRAVAKKVSNRGNEYD